MEEEDVEEEEEEDEEDEEDDDEEEEEEGKEEEEEEVFMAPTLPLTSLLFLSNASAPAAPELLSTRPEEVVGFVVR